MLGGLPALLAQLFPAWLGPMKAAFVGFGVAALLLSIPVALAGLVVIAAGREVRNPQRRQRDRETDAILDHALEAEGDGPVVLLDEARSALPWENR